MGDPGSHSVEIGPHAYEPLPGRRVDRRAMYFSTITPAGKAKGAREISASEHLGFARLSVLAAFVVGFVQLLLASSPVLAAHQYSGVEITVGVMAAPAIGNPAKAHAKTWEQNTGGKVRIIEYPYNELFDRFMEALVSENGSFDVIFYASQWAGDFFPYLSEVPKELSSQETFDDILSIYLDRLMKWEGKTVSVTIDGDLYFGYYRKDLFQEPLNRTEFKSKYGYDLAPPDTWKQYRDIAEFFHGRRSPEGKIISGTTEPFALGTQQFSDVFSRAAAYTNLPESPGTQFFDPDTMKAQIRNEGWKKAVQDYVEVFRFCPKGSERYGILDTREAFVRGEAAMTLDWGDTGQLAADPKRSSVVGKVGYFVLPGVEQVWNSREGGWEKRQRPHKVPFLAFGGWVGGVPGNSRQKEAAWDFILWYASPENSLHDVVNSDTGINPYRYSHFTNIDAWTKSFPRESASEYLDVIRISLESPHVALDLRIPGFNEYTTVFEKEVYRAVTGEISVQQALDNAAAQWDAITDRRGREKQRSLYRSSMGLAPR
jgi:multiple sugar transport system substrate-binding protein